MILSYSDLIRILSAGYALHFFAYFDGKYWRLRNIQGKCVFLDKNGLCKIYKIRPKGCKAYPVIIVETDSEKICYIDKEVCPLHEKMTDEEIKRGCEILKRLLRELGEY